ncbi:2TM domain-containing protein [Geitlerinema sp. PCC 9228]|jgi:hypothetical protein|uniref:2TM domain-containing protein n=1 Tax=Geitlerinema sp. PCC 9228 TaxID=111611 RepID=UPI0008F9B728|nr:2TM domain-containing protein [Geitlerinema sp. PCC 9228]
MATDLPKTSQTPSSDSASSGYYDQEDVQQILQLAIARQHDSGQFSRQELVEMAAELGISLETLQKAEADWIEKQKDLQMRQDFDRYRRSRFKSNVVKYAIANGFLIALNLLMSHQLSWSLYIALIWGGSLTWNAWKTFSLEGEEYEREYQKWRLKKQIGQSIQSIGNAIERFLNPQNTSNDAN